MKKLMSEIPIFIIKALIIGALLTVVVYFALQIYTQKVIDSNLSVEGTASQIVKADSAVIVLGADIDGTSPTGLVDEANKRIARLNDWSQKLGITTDSIRVKDFSISTTYDNTQKPSGYRMNVSLEETISDLGTDDKIIGDIVEAGTNGGLNQVRSINFISKTTDNVLDSLKKQAIDDAKSQLDKISQASALKRDPKNIVVKVLNSDANDKGIVGTQNFELKAIATLYY